MTIIKVRGRPVDVDLVAELEAFEWTRPRWTSDKLLAASPFRYDRTPSFFVNLSEGDYAGAWSDSGYYDEEWKSGGFVKLLSFLRNETYEETEDYLLESYAADWSSGEISLKLPKLEIEKERRYLSEDLLSEYRYRHPYLEKRAIPDKIQRLYNVGYDRNRQAVVIPWYDARGRLANVKYRLIRGKTFWYEKGAVPIRELVYGLNVVHSRSIRSAVLCEAEIDAMSWASVGKFGIAVGGVNFTDVQADMIKRSPIEHLIIAADNDKAGAKLVEQVERKMRGYVELESVDWRGIQAKDANEALVTENLQVIRTNSVESLRFDKMRP